jgi:hypothetical protein
MLGERGEQRREREKERERECVSEDRNEFRK